MKTARKAILLVLCVICLVVASVMGTLAYLTDTETVENTFTVGNIVITLNEEDVDGSSANKDRDQANEYHLLPGKDYKKDPTIHVDASSEECYLFVAVNNGIAQIEAATGTTKTNGTTYTNIADQMTAKGWVALDADKYPNVYYLAANGTPVTNNAGTNPVVFSEFMIDGNKAVNVAEGETAPAGKYDIAAYTTADNSVKITVAAYAVQKEGFATPAAAWAATFGASN